MTGALRGRRPVPARAVAVGLVLLGLSGTSRADTPPIPSTAPAPPAETPATPAPRAWPAGDALVHPRHGLAVSAFVINDNLLFGLWGAIARLEDGDDFGHTHGAGLSFEGLLDRAGHLRWTVFGSTNLYTKRIGWRPNNDDDRGAYTLQHFTNDNVLMFGVDNDPAPGWLRGRLWVGWHRLDSANFGPFIQAGGQQMWMHDLVTAVAPLQAITPDPVPDRYGVLDGVRIEAEVGLGRRLALPDRRFAVEVLAMTGTMVSTIAEAEELRFRARVGAAWEEARERRLAVRVFTEVSAALHRGGTRGSVLFGPQIGDEHLSGTLSFDVPFGQLRTYPRYTDRSSNKDRHEPIGTVTFRGVIPVRWAHRRRGPEDDAP